ncbi:hypothetical protein BLOT_011395 [Blomia tropicalis]|nr:hypothetical protein BLOT_011395 [Blomia tropicalis]
MDLATDHWYDTLEHQIGSRSLGRHSGTWTWPPIIITTLWNINLFYAEAVKLNINPDVDVLNYV